MRFLNLHFLIFILLNFQLFSQNDSTILDPRFGLNDGVFLSYYDFRHNHPILKSDLITNLDTNQIDFIAKALSHEKFKFQKDGSVNTMESKKVWGFFQNNALHLCYNSEFYRVPVFGVISYLVATVKVINPGYYDPRFGQIGNTTTTELKEFLMSIYDGSIQEFTIQRAEELMSTDKVFFEEYRKLSVNKRRKQIYGNIRRFNTLHPIYFLR